MRAATCCVLFPLVALGVPAKATSQVAVTFTAPEHYRDASLYGGTGARAREPALSAIRAYLESLGKRYLRPDQSLTVEVLDIDLAGRFEWWRPLASNVRILNDITWPSVKVRYVLTEKGQDLANAEETISDLNYLMTTPTGFSSDPLRYEKAMIEAWFHKRFVRMQPPQG